MATMPARNVFDGAHVARPRVLDAELQAPWCVVVERSDDTYLYVVRRGSCLLDSDGLDAPLRLSAGDIVTLVAADPDKAAGLPSEAIALLLARCFTVQGQLFSSRG